MFGNLTDKLDGIFRKLKGADVWTREYRSALKEICGLAEADVNFRSSEGFHRRSTAGRPWAEVLESITPDA